MPKEYHTHIGLVCALLRSLFYMEDVPIVMRLVYNVHCIYKKNIIVGVGKIQNEIYDYYVVFGKSIYLSHRSIINSLLYNSIN